MRSSPFNLQDQAEVKATVVAINEIGDSGTSNVGGGATIPVSATIPGAPTDLTEDVD